MKKTNLFMFAAGIVLATANAPVTMAQKTQVEAITSSTLPVTRVTEGTDGTSRVYKGAAPSAAKIRANGDSAGVTDLSITDESVHIAAPANIGGSFYFNAPEKILNISVYGLAGNCIGSVDCGESELKLPASSLNITQPGVYVISIKTSTCITARKVALK